jgi:hypothetical protein
MLLIKLTRFLIMSQLASTQERQTGMLRDMNMNLEDYRGHIDRVIREMSGETVLNGSHSHATILIERMFANAERSMDILTRKFDPRVFGTSEAIEQAELFLGDSDRKARVLLEELEESHLSSHPFIQRLRGFWEFGNLEIKVLPKKYADDINLNFAVMDDSGYRFERDKSKPIAVAAFGDKDFPKRLKEFFDTLWDISAPVQLSELAPAC